MRRARTITLAVAVALPSCFDEASSLSEEIATGDLGVYVTGVAGEDATRLEVSLSGAEAAASAVRIVGADRLRLTSGGLTVRPTSGEPGYVVSLPPDVGDWTLHLDREVDESARVVLPVPPLSRPTADASFARSGGLVVRWSPSDDPRFPVALRLEGPCVPTIERRLTPDPGGYTFQPADLGGSGATCDVALVLSRSHQGLDETSPLRFAQYAIGSAERLVVESRP